MRPNYQGVSIGRIKTMLNEAYALHYMKNCDFCDWKKPHEETFAVVLMQDEVDTLWAADLKNERLAKAVELFPPFLFLFFLKRVTLCPIANYSIAIDL